MLGVTIVGDGALKTVLQYVRLTVSYVWSCPVNIETICSFLHDVEVVALRLALMVILLDGLFKIVVGVLSK